MYSSRRRRYSGFCGLVQKTKQLLFIVLTALPLWAQAQGNPDIQLYYELLNRIELLEQEIRQLRGDLEVYQHRAQPGRSNTVSPAYTDIRQSAEYQALERRIEILERGSASANTGSSPAPVIRTQPLPSSQPPVSQPETVLRSQPSAPAQQQFNTRPQTGGAPGQEEQNAYNTAFNLLLEGRYEGAIAEFRNFLDFYPNSSLAGDAYYWLGESYYVIREFGAAEEIFLTLGARYPNSEKIPDTLLKLGYLYTETGRPDTAKQVLQRLVTSYPTSQAAGLAEKQLRQLR